MGNFHLNQAVMALNMGGIIAYPTEAVFGLGCYPEDFCSVAKILSLKDRSVNKGLIDSRQRWTDSALCRISR